MKPGPKPKGGVPRTRVSVRFPPTQLDVHDARAKKLGLSRDHYIVKVLAESDGLPVPDYIVDEMKKYQEAMKARRSRRPKATQPSLLEETAA